MVRRSVNCPPVDCCRIQVDQASPALSSRVTTATPIVDAAAIVTRPPVTSSSGLALRVMAIRAPAAIIPAAATAAATGSSHCCIRATAGSVARSGDPILIHQLAVFATVQRTPSLMA